MVITEWKQKCVSIKKKKEVILATGENLLKNVNIKANDLTTDHIDNLLTICIHRWRLSFSSSSF